MKILIIHNAYHYVGGEDRVVESESTLLTQHGHEVQLYRVSNQSIRSVSQKIKTALRLKNNPKTISELRNKLKTFQPDIVHAHNLFPLITPAVYSLCFANHTPVIQTLHNFRFLCQNGLLFRQHKICNQCLTGSLWHGLAHRCYKHSYFGSFFVMRYLQWLKQQHYFEHWISKYIALTSFSKELFIRAGFPKNKIIVKPNFTDSPGSPTLPDDQRKGVLFAGRLSEEKGVRVLLNAWKKISEPLYLAGEGPLKPLCQQAGNNIIYLGFQSKEAFYKTLSTVKLLIVPSLWHETFCLVAIEAFSLGIPVIASRVGSFPELIEQHDAGVLFSPGDENDLIQKITDLLSDPHQLRIKGHHAKMAFQNYYSSEQNYEQLILIYRDALAKKSAEIIPNSD